MILPLLLLLDFVAAQNNATSNTTSSPPTITFPAVATTPLAGAPVVSYLLDYCADPTENGGNGVDSGNTNFKNCETVTYDKFYEENYKKFNMTRLPASVATEGWNCSSVAWEIFYCSKCKPGFVMNVNVEVEDDP